MIPKNLEPKKSVKLSKYQIVLTVTNQKVSPSIFYVYVPQVQRGLSQFARHVPKSVIRSTPLLLKSQVLIFVIVD